MLVVGIGRGHDELFGGRAKNGLLRVIGAIGEAGHPYLQGNSILGFAQVGVDIQRDDLMGGGVERERHLITGLGVVLEDQIHHASRRI